MSHRVGTYIQSFAERDGGSCGAIGDQVIVIGDNGGALPDGCAFDGDDITSADECKLTRRYTCPLDGAPGTASFVAVSVEQAGGRKLTGTVTATMYDGGGALVCKSTYDVSAERQ